MDNLCCLWNNGNFTLHVPSKYNLGWRTTPGICNFSNHSVLEQWRCTIAIATGDSEIMDWVGVPKWSIPSNCDVVFEVLLNPILLLKIWMKLKLMNLWLDCCISYNITNLGWREVGNSNETCTFF